MNKRKISLEEELLRVHKLNNYLLKEADDFNQQNDFNNNQNKNQFDDQSQDGVGGEPEPFGTQDNVDDFGSKDGDIVGDTGGDTEVDVTDLVRGIEDANNSANDTKMSIENVTQQISDMLSKVGDLENRLGVMDQLLSKVDQLNLTVDKMRPPTETERIEALKQKSYPYSVAPEDYLNQTGEKTATDLEKRQTKLSFKDILSDFNASDVRSSFNYRDPIQSEINTLMPPYRN